MATDNNPISIFRSVDKWGILLYLLMVIAGWLSIYGASYDFERKPLISHNKNSRISYNETAHVYVVTYLYDPYKYVMNNAFTASVKIFANTGKVYDVFFGVGRGAYNLHINEYDGHFSYRQSETNPQLAARIIEKQQYLIDRAAEYEREGVTIEAGSVGGGTIKPPTTRPSK